MFHRRPTPTSETSPGTGLPTIIPEPAAALVAQVDVFAQPSVPLPRFHATCTRDLCQGLNLSSMWSVAGAGVWCRSSRAGRMAAVQGAQVANLPDREDERLVGTSLLAIWLRVHGRERPIPRRSAPDSLSTFGRSASSEYARLEALGAIWHVVQRERGERWNQQGATAIMPIFARRRLQAMLTDLAPLLDDRRRAT